MEKEEEELRSRICHEEEEIKAKVAQNETLYCGWDSVKETISHECASTPSVLPD
jgi:hypothetical protein